MNNAEIRSMFNGVLSDLPSEMRISPNQSEKIINQFLNNVKEPLQDIIMNMIERIDEEGKLSAVDQQTVIKDLMKIIVPYIQNVVGNETLQ